MNSALKTKEQKVYSSIVEHLSKTLGNAEIDVAEQARAVSVAKYLNMSLRTIQRRLKVLDLTYADILDSLRQDASRVLLEAGTSVNDVAKLLGYKDRNCYRSAHIRWHSLPPREYRRQLKTRVRNLSSSS